MKSNLAGLSFLLLVAACNPSSYSVKLAGATNSNHIGLTLQANNVASSASKLQSYNDGDTVLVPGRQWPVGNGAKVFAGWCSDLPCASVSDRAYLVGEYITISGNTSLHALWVDPTPLWSGVTIGDLVIPNGELLPIDIFNGVSLTSVIIPDSVTDIGIRSFQSNQIQSVTIPNSVTNIGDFAFYSNQLTSVVLPDSVVDIREYAFGGNSITSVVIPRSVTQIHDKAFSVNQISSLTIPDSVLSIGVGAFEYNQLTSLTIPSSVISLAGFGDNQLTTLNIPNSVTTVGYDAFSYNALNSVTLPNSLLVIGERSLPSLTLLLPLTNQHLLTIN